MKKILRLFTQSGIAWSNDNAPRLGASLAFYTLLSISPLVILIIAIVTLVFSRSSAQGLLLAQVQSLIGQGGKDAVETMLASGQRQWSGILSSALGIVTLFFGASGVFTELRSALNTVWHQCVDNVGRHPAQFTERQGRAQAKTAKQFSSCRGLAA